MISIDQKIRISGMPNVGDYMLAKKTGSTITFKVSEKTSLVYSINADYMADGTYVIEISRQTDMRLYDTFTGIHLQTIPIRDTMLAIDG